MSVSNIIASTELGNVLNMPVGSAQYLQGETQFYSASDVVASRIALSLDKGACIQFNNVGASVSVDLPALTSATKYTGCLFTLSNRGVNPLTLVANVASSDLLTWRGAIEGGGAGTYVMRPWETCLITPITGAVYAVFPSGIGQTTAEDTNTTTGQQRSGYFTTNASGATGAIIACSSIGASSDVILCYVCPLNATSSAPATTQAVGTTGSGTTLRPTGAGGVPLIAVTPGLGFSTIAGLHPNSIYSYIVLG